MEESTLTHLSHALVITIILYLIMLLLVKQTHEMALHRSVLLGAVALIYMLLFGHELPKL